MGTEKLELDDIEKLKNRICADWINRLDLRIVATGPDWAEFKWFTTPELFRDVNEGDQIVSGQATMAIADTASFMMICAINNRFRNCVTVDLHTHFLRPLENGVIDVKVTAIASGRRTVTSRSEFKMENRERLCATATGVFMYLDEGDKL